jgi:rubrerythrin
MSDKPSYLGLLNAIAVGESRGYELLSTWSEQTPNPELAQVLNFVAIREQEHAATFTKRLCELGYSVRQKSNDRFAEHLKLAGSDADDRDKFAEILGYGSASDDSRGDSRDESSDDPLAKLFDDATIDPATGALLGRFIAEERDSGRRLRGACEQLGDPATDDNMLKEIAERLDRLSSTLEELKTLRR